MGAPAQTPRPFRRTWVQQLMGMPVSVTLRGTAVRTARAEDAVAEAYDILRRVDETFSTYRDGSDIVRMQRGELELADAAPEVTEVLDLCQQASAETGGLFTAFLPCRSGADLVFDPTGLVKGWAIARAGAVLAELPGVAWCVNAGGDIAVGGDPDAPGERGRPWTFGIEDPRVRGRVAQVVELTGSMAMATSGTAVRGAHLYDPARGTWPMRSGSVTVIGPDILWADVWATACWVGTSFTDELLRARRPRYDIVRL